MSSPKLVVPTKRRRRCTSRVQGKGKIYFDSVSNESFLCSWQIQKHLRKEIDGKNEHNIYDAMSECRSRKILSSFVNEKRYRAQIFYRVQRCWQAKKIVAMMLFPSRTGNPIISCISALCGAVAVWLQQLLCIITTSTNKQTKILYLVLRLIALSKLSVLKQENTHTENRRHENVLNIFQQTHRNTDRLHKHLKKERL